MTITINLWTLAKWAGFGLGALALVCAGAVLGAWWITRGGIWR